MDKQIEIVNLKFGLKQLNGNRALYIKLLGKFRHEYLDLSERLTALYINQDISECKLVIHTVKGVSGNLGLNALNLAAKELEIKLFKQQEVESQIKCFTDTLEETLSQIHRLEAEQITEIDNSSQSQQMTAKMQLTDALNRNEFIPPEKLSLILEQCQFSDSLKRQIEISISDLDYLEAIRLMQLTS
jgi:HPt (histidine-containing phosphotransfer) domain-containing protein